MELPRNTTRNKEKETHLLGGLYSCGLMLGDSWRIQTGSHLSSLYCHWLWAERHLDGVAVGAKEGLSRWHLSGGVDSSDTRVSWEWRRGSVAAPCITATRESDSLLGKIITQPGVAFLLWFCLFYWENVEESLAGDTVIILNCSGLIWKYKKGLLGCRGGGSVGNKLALLVGGFKLNPQNPHKRVSSGGRSL